MSPGFCLHGTLHSLCTNFADSVLYTLVRGQSIEMKRTRLFQALLYLADSTFEAINTYIPYYISTTTMTTTTMTIMIAMHGDDNDDDEGDDDVDKLYNDDDGDYDDVDDDDGRRRRR